MSEQLRFDFLTPTAEESFISQFTFTGYTYAKVGGPPDDWCGLVVINMDTFEEISNVIKVDTDNGRVERYCTENFDEIGVYWYNNIAICRPEVNY